MQKMHLLGPMDLRADVAASTVLAPVALADVMDERLFAIVPMVAPADVTDVLLFDIARTVALADVTDERLFVIVPMAALVAPVGVMDERLFVIVRMAALVAPADVSVIAFIATSIAIALATVARADAQVVLVAAPVVTTAAITMVEESSALHLLKMLLQKPHRPNQLHLHNQEPQLNQMLMLQRLQLM